MLHQFWCTTLPTIKEGSSGRIGATPLFMLTLSGECFVPEGNVSFESGSMLKNRGLLRPLRIAIFGFGTVGSSVARILTESRPEGLELTHVFNRGVGRKRVDWANGVEWSEDSDAVLASDVDVVVELAGGMDPAGSWVRRALEAGKSVVTANKKLIAFHGVELERLAAARRRTPEVWGSGCRRDPGDSGTGAGPGGRSH